MERPQTHRCLSVAPLRVFGNVCDEEIILLWPKAKDPFTRVLLSRFKRQRQNRRQRDYDALSFESTPSRQIRLPGRR